MNVRICMPVSALGCHKMGCHKYPIIIIIIITSVSCKPSSLVGLMSKQSLTKSQILHLQTVYVYTDLDC